MSQPGEEDTHVDVADLPRSSLDELLGEVSMERHVINCSDLDEMVYVISLLLNMSLDFTADASDYAIYIRGQ